MLKSPKQKGYRHEIECKELAERHGLETVRAFASDGRAIGERSDVDVLIKNSNLDKDDRFAKVRVQCKSRKTIPKYFDLGNADIKTMRGNNIKDFKCIVDYEWLMECLSRVH
tara:strand:+ start:1079 stop:1414 length:336 start_codon:yes stop_codon:yes gene_type:complete